MFNFWPFKKKKVVPVRNYVSVEQVTEEINAMLSNADEEITDLDIIIELEKIYARMYEDQCGKIPKFVVNLYGKVELR